MICPNNLPCILFVETPMTTPEGVWFDGTDHMLANPGPLILNWDKKNLTMQAGAKVEISIWGYRETTITPEFVFIDIIEVGFN